MPLFSISESLKFAWDKMRANSGKIFPGVVLLAIIQITDHFSNNFLTPSIALYVAQFFLFFLETILEIGVLIVLLRIARSEETKLRDFMPPGRLVARILFAELVVILMTIGIVFVAALIGTIGYFGFVVIPPLRYLIPVLAIIAGISGAIFIWTKYFFLLYTAIDLSQATPSASLHPSLLLQKSASLTEGVRKHLLLFIFVTVLIGILGMITVIGMLLTIPLVYLASAFVYMKLKERMIATIE